MALTVVLLLFIASLTRGRAEDCQPPTGVMAEAVGADGVHVTWEQPPDGNCRTGLTFTVSYTPERGGVTLSTGAGGPSASDYTVLGLHCNTAYIFTVGTVTREDGSVVWSEGVRALAGGPRNFSAQAVSSTSVHLTWEPPASPCDIDESITGYEVMYTCSECGMPGEGSSPALTGVEYTFDHLEEDTEYQFRLRAAGKDFTDPLSMRTPTAVTKNTDTSSESLGAGEITVTLLVTAAKTASRTSPADHITGEQLPTPTNGSPTSSSGGGSNSPVGVAVGVAVVTVLLVVIIIVVIAILILWIRQCKQPVRDKGMIPVELGAIVPTKADFDASSEKENEQTTGVDNINYEKVQAHPPAVKDYQEKVHTQEGQEVTLQVKVTGLPLPTVTWFLGGRKVESDYSTEVRDDGSLTFTCVEPKHAGTYYFSASNSEGSVKGNTKLIVHADDDEAEEGGSAPKLESNPVQVEMFGEYVAGLHANSNAGFIVQYQTLPSGEDDQLVTVARTPENKNWNRFKNIVVYDGNRVVLKPIPGHRSLQHDYINASYIDGYSQRKRYIACQGPLPATTADLWRLVWQENIQAIFMVTNVVEGGHDKCEQYWPDSGSQQYGPFRLTLTEQQVFADYIIRTMQLESENGNPKKVIQYHFTSWPDHGVPEYAGPILAYHRRLKAKHRPSRGPILIHCSAGVGRTGTLICIDIALEQAAREGVVDIAGIVSKIRKQRMKMVQTTDQYVFIHDAVLESLICGNTQIPASNLKGAITKLGQKDSESGRTGFETQFHVLHQVTPKPTEVVRATGLKFPNKNREMNFLPPDKWRVLLKSEVPDYIHASFANGYKQSKGFIIAQAPMKSTRRDFWKMVYERECGVIVMLSDLTENGEELCHQYWPSPPGKAVQKYGEYAVCTQKEVEFEGFTQRIINVTDPQSGQVQKVTQFQLSGWTPDSLCTNTRAIIDTIEQVGGVQRRTGNKPIVIHGSDTVSRSGVFCTLMNMIECCKTEGIVDVFQVVKALRIQKPGSVLTVEQYRFIFDMMLLFLDSFSIYSNFK